MASQVGDAVKVKVPFSCAFTEEVGGVRAKGSLQVSAGAVGRIVKISGSKLYVHLNLDRLTGTAEEKFDFDEKDLEPYSGLVPGEFIEDQSGRPVDVNY